VEGREAKERGSRGKGERQRWVAATVVHRQAAAVADEGATGGRGVPAAGPLESSASSHQVNRMPCEVIVG